MQKDNQQMQGLVISYYGSQVAVLPDQTANDEKLVQCHLRRNQSLPVVGDRVNFDYDAEDDHGVITGILPRASILERYEGHGHMKPVAANLDIILIVMAPPPIYAEYLIDRYIVAAELSNMPVALVLNKKDLLANQTAAEALTARLKPYRELAYPVLLTSIFDEASIEVLRDFLRAKTAVLVGPSGVGKSSIIAKLAKLATIKVGDVSKKGTGKHTTTATRLYRLPSGGNVIDSPGVREFNLWPVSQAELKRGFKELSNFKEQCKFRDCRHLAEPGCAVLMAVEDGKISRERLANYQALWQKSKQSK